MRLFSTGKAKKNKVAKVGKRVLIVTGVMLALFMAAPAVGGGNNMFSMNAYAAEQSQGYNWVQEGPVWKVKDTVGNYVVNDWFKDANGVYYYMGADGAMQTGIVNVAGHFYYMGTDGKMVTTDGVYNGVNLVFNKDTTSPTYGEVISGAQEYNAATQTQNTQQQQVSQNQNNNAAPVDGEIRTFKNGITKQYVAAANCWITIDNGTGGVVDGNGWDSKAQALSESIGRNMK